MQYPKIGTCAQNSTVETQTASCSEGHAASNNPGSSMQGQCPAKEPHVARGPTVRAPRWSTLAATCDGQSPMHERKRTIDFGPEDPVLSRATASRPRTIKEQTSDRPSACPRARRFARTRHRCRSAAPAGTQNACVPVTSAVPVHGTARNDEAVKLRGPEIPRQIHRE